MEPSVIHPDEAAEFETPERCAILELSNDADDSALSIARARVAVGETTAWHHLRGVDERYVILAGEGLVELGDLPAHTVRVGDVVRIPAEVRQRIRNTGNDELVFYALCTPRFTPECYVALE